jgi:hypothetical protein
MVLKHAVRIANTCIPVRTCPPRAQFFSLPRGTGAFFLSARRIQHTRIRALEIIQNLNARFLTIDSEVPFAVAGLFSAFVRAVYASTVTL